MFWVTNGINFFLFCYTIESTTEAVQVTDVNGYRPSVKNNKRRIYYE